VVRWQDVEVETDVTVLEMVLASDSGPAKAVRDYEAAMVSQESERLTKAISNMDALQAWTVRTHPQAQTGREWCVCNGEERAIRFLLNCRTRFDGAADHGGGVMMMVFPAAAI